jgi:hypothetical protein
MKERVTIFILFLTFGTIICEAGKYDYWDKLQKIEPLISTREDVEKIFGKPTYLPFKHSHIIEDYDIKSGRLTVDYSDGKCSENSKCPPKDTVLDFSFSPDYPSKKTLFIKFIKIKKIDLLKFIKSEWAEGDTPSRGHNYDLSDKSIRLVTLELDGKIYLESIEVDSWKTFKELTKKR